MLVGCERPFVLRMWVMRWNEPPGHASKRLDSPAWKPKEKGGGSNIEQVNAKRGTLFAGGSLFGLCSLGLMLASDTQNPKMKMNPKTEIYYPTPSVCTAFWTPEDWEKVALRRTEPLTIQSSLGKWVATHRDEATGELMYSLEK